MFVIALIYLSLPVFIMLFTFFSLPYVIMTAALLVVFVFCLHHSYQTEREAFRLDINFKRHWPLLLVVLLVVVTLLPSFSPANFDWYKHYVVFNSLINNTWPPIIDWQYSEYTLRYYLGYYIVPALGAKLFGYYCLPYLVALWTAIGLCLALLIALHLVSNAKHFLTAVVVILFFSGLDLIRALILDSWTPVDSHWLQWSKYGEVSPNMFAITWVPQHGICAWLAVCMFLRHPRLSLKYSGLLGVVVAMWSPFVAIGLIPVIVWSVCKEGFKPVLSWQNLVLTWLGVPIALYMTTDTAALPLIFFWQEDSHSMLELVLFCLLEFGIIAGMIYWMRRQDALLITINLVFVACIALFRYGYGHDLLMRVSMPFVFILSLLCVKALLQPNCTRRKILLAVLLVAAAVPVSFATSKTIFSSRESNLAAIDFRHDWVTLLALAEDPDTEKKIIPQYLAKREKMLPLLR